MAAKRGETVQVVYNCEVCVQSKDNQGSPSWIRRTLPTDSRLCVKVNHHNNIVIRVGGQQDVQLIDHNVNAFGGEQ